MSSLRPCLVVADNDGNIYDEPDLFMLCRKGNDLALPKPDELMPLPKDSELFLLPARNAIGLDPETGETIVHDALAVAAFAAPAHTLSAHPAYEKHPNATTLPLFAYGAVGFANNRFYICAKKIDTDTRHVFTHISQKNLKEKAIKIAKTYPDNKLVQHIVYQCALTYGCQNAKNFCLGRFEAPLPTSRTCNARCIGCISHQLEDSPICTAPQNRLTFCPSPQDIAEVMLHHALHAEKPIVSFGQGCEGEPLTETSCIAKAIELFTKQGKKATIHMNTNASLPEKIQELALAGLSSIRVSVNSLREEPYTRYYRPQGYAFADVLQSIQVAKKHNIYVSLNLLFFPGFTDTEKEIEAICTLLASGSIDCVQLRNLNIDPDMYLELMDGIETGPSFGLINFIKRVKKAHSGITLAYFNQFVSK